jgi:3-methyladenine DNA glycosylase Tag
MEVITIESKAFKDLTTKIGTIAKFVSAIQAKTDAEPEDGWVDSYEVCEYLKISAKTLQRLRAAQSVNYSRIRGKVFYRISEIERLMNDNVIRRSEDQLQNLIKNHQFHVEQRRNIKKDK